MIRHMVGQPGEMELVRYILILFGILWCLPVFAEDNSTEMPIEGQSMTTRFKIAVIGDTHFAEDGQFDGRRLLIPDVDLIVMVGDWVSHGSVAEYEAASAWAKSLKAPFILVRGNHDNGPWNRYARGVCDAELAAALQRHSDVERMGMVEWKPMVWEETLEPVVWFDRQTAWNRIPADVQKYIVKVKDVTPGYYSFNAGGMKFICLDTSDWQLGHEQIEWLTGEVASATQSVVLLGHHHFLPVGSVFDDCQVHERDFLREYVLQNDKIVAYVHGHAHFDRWWKYGHVDVISVGIQTVRTITFEDGKIVRSSLAGQEPDLPEPFFFGSMYAQCMQPGRVVYLMAEAFAEEPADGETAKVNCLGWLDPGAEEVELVWSMRVPESLDMPPGPYELSFEVCCEAGCRVQASGAALGRTYVKEVSPSGEMQMVHVAIDDISDGLFRATLRCARGWGYAAIAATLAVQE